MKSKFIELWKLVMEDINTQRKPIQKIDAMNEKTFIEFLKEFLPYVKDGKVDLNDVRITEKVDGQAFRILTKNGEMLFESSYSGATTWDKVPIKDAAKFVYDQYSQICQDIYEEIGSDFKLIGEIIWIDEEEETGKVTPVCASYLTSKFGRHGGMVVFDIKKVEDDNLTDFPEEVEEQLFGMIEDMNNEDFSFYLASSIDITKNVNIDLDVNSLLQAISKPEYSAARISKVAKAEIQQIKADVTRQLSQIIDNTQGAFSEEGDLIEGIVVRINSSGNQYGMFSDKYRDVKHGYWNTYQRSEQPMGRVLQASVQVSAYAEKQESCSSFRC